MPARSGACRVPSARASSAAAPGMTPTRVRAARSYQPPGGRTCPPRAGTRDIRRQQVDDVLVARRQRGELAGLWRLPHTEWHAQTVEPAIGDQDACLFDRRRRTAEAPER